MSDSSRLGSVLNQAWGKFFPGETFAELNKIFSSLHVLGHLPLEPVAQRLHLPRRLVYLPPALTGSLSTGAQPAGAPGPHCTLLEGRAPVNGPDSRG